jgi:hypothetical protein
MSFEGSKDAFDMMVQVEADRGCWSFKPGGDRGADGFRRWAQCENFELCDEVNSSE